jgi:hypothetical protein
LSPCSRGGEEEEEEEEEDFIQGEESTLINLKR